MVGLSRGVLNVREQEIKAAPSVKLWTHERLLAVRCDVRLRAQVEEAVKKTLEQFGKLDIVVKYAIPRNVADCSCAGWGILGACEEQTDFELRSQFETNVYGTFNMIRQTLPILRSRESARYINLTSTSLILAMTELTSSRNYGGSRTRSLLRNQVGYRRVNRVFITRARRFRM